jgi:hypothetical protein
MTPRVVELYYSVTELACLLRFSDSTVRKWVKSGAFSPPGPDGKPDFTNILDVHGDIRVPSSGVFFFTQNNQLRRDFGTKARNKAELMRRLHHKEEAHHG